MARTLLAVILTFRVYDTRKNMSASGLTQAWPVTRLDIFEYVEPFSYVESFGYFESFGIRVSRAHAPAVHLARDVLIQLFVKDAPVFLMPGSELFFTEESAGRVMFTVNPQEGT